MIVSKKHLMEFVLYSLVFTFFIQGIILFANQYNMLLFGSSFGMLFYVMSTLAPTIVAGVVLIRGKYITSVKQLFKVMFHIRASLQQYCLVAIFVFWQYIFLIIFTPVREGGNIFIAVAMVVPCIFDGGLEELGWRYILGPSLESKMNYIVATICTAVVWYFWHILHFFINGTGQHNISFGVYFIFVLGAAFSLSAMFRITKNIWLCTICHATINALSFCYSVATYFVATVATTVVLIIVSITLVVYSERKHRNQKTNSNLTEKV